MASDQMRTLLASLGPVSEARRASLEPPVGARAPALNPLGLRFAVGDAVLDLVTGRAGVIQYGTRDAQTNAELYRVQLADASVQYRSRAQLEPAPAAPKG